MASRGFLIRFIDIGLIVLFGFLMISDIEATSRVELAGGGDETEVPEAEPVEERAYLVVEIGPEGGFRVTDMGVAGVPGPESEDEPDAATESAGSPEGGEDAGAGDALTAVMVSDVDALSNVLSAGRADHRAAGLQTVVLIQPHPSSVVQHTVDVMDACDRLSLPKSLRMNIQIEAVPDEAGPADSGQDRSAATARRDEGAGAS